MCVFKARVTLCDKQEILNPRKMVAQRLRPACLTLGMKRDRLSLGFKANGRSTRTSTSCAAVLRFGKTRLSERD